MKFAVAVEDAGAVEAEELFAEAVAEKFAVAGREGGPVAPQPAVEGKGLRDGAVEDVGFGDDPVLVVFDESERFRAGESALLKEMGGGPGVAGAAGSEVAAPDARVRGEGFDDDRFAEQDAAVNGGAAGPMQGAGFAAAEGLQFGKQCGMFLQGAAEPASAVSGAGGRGRHLLQEGAEVFGLAGGQVPLGLQKPLAGKAAGTPFFGVFAVKAAAKAQEKAPGLGGGEAEEIPAVAEAQQVGGQQGAVGQGDRPRGEGEEHEVAGLEAAGGLIDVGKTAAAADIGGAGSGGFAEERSAQGRGIGPHAQGAQGAIWYPGSCRQHGPLSPCFCQSGKTDAV